MQEYRATVTSKGQLTLPAAVRRELGVQPGDKVAFTIKGDLAELRRERYTIESVQGLIPALPGVETGDFDDLIEEAMAEHADAVVRRMRQGLE